MRLNFTNSIAYIVVGAFVYTIVTRFTDNPSIFINKEGMAVVGGGLLVAAFASFPLLTLRQTFRVVMQAFSQNVRVPTEEAREIVRLSLMTRRGLAAIEPELERIEDPFLKSGAELLLDGMSPKVYLAIMQKRVTEFSERQSRAVSVLLTLSKFAPSLGLAATVLGLVQLLSKLGDSDMNTLGTGMAVALAGTFYGIIIANMVFQPLSELVQMRSENEIKCREMILEGLHSILERHEPLVIGELVNSFLPDPSRIDFTSELEELSGGAAGSGKKKPGLEAAA